MNATLRKIKNVALAAALAAGFAGAFALSNLSAVQAQEPTQQPKPSPRVIKEDSPADMQNAYMEGRYWGWNDKSQGASFRPCAHQEYIDGSDPYKRYFIKGYSEMHY
jgi:hypothetical protein